MIWLDYVVLIGYFAAMIAIGIWSMGRIKGQEDYFMGGRGFGKLLQTFAAFGAGTGAHEPVTVGRTGWTSGLSGVWSALMWLFVTPVYWIVAVWYRRMRHITLGDWFVERYESRWMGIAYSMFAITFYMFFLSTMFSAIAKFSVPLLGTETIAGLELKYVLVPGIAVIVILYGVLGGLTAAYYTDLIQGVFIIVLSILLIPFGLMALVSTYGDPTTMGIMDGFRILHERVPKDYFSLFAGPSAGEFPMQYIIALSILGLIGVVVQPHFIATGGGSAKSEDEARIGLVIGNFLKRLCTVGWALTALIALALLAGNAEIAMDADRVWGVAAREILGPMKCGLVGLMLACLMAAMMSSADAYMIVTAGLVTRNVYAAFINPNASEKTYVLVGRLSGLSIILGASVVAITMADVFEQFKFAVELPILFAAPFWVGMFWRRANRTAVWITIVFSLFAFFLLPPILPRIFPAMRSDVRFAAATHKITRMTTRDATPADIARHDAWQKITDQATSDGNDKLLNLMGTEPPTAKVGESIIVTTTSGGGSVYWSENLMPVGETKLETVREYDEGVSHVLVQRTIGTFSGQGDFNLDFFLYALAGFDLSQASKATIETLRLPPRVLAPFLVLILVSLVTPRNRREALDRYYVKMKTEVDPDPEQDRKNLDESYSNPKRFEKLRMFPGSDFEMLRPRPKDVIGVLLSVAACGAIIGLLVFLAGLGAA
ncbi:MAG: sodium:solute symporter family protein [Pirellulaceae bacterium]|nr:sodium:solute symporter family protein [Pirellulaceae bacterium]